MNRLIVGFGHRIGRGKDTSADFALAYLKKKGYPCRKDAFAYSLKEGIGRLVFGFDDEQLYGKRKEVKDEFWGFTPRWALQQAGTEAMRNNLNYDIWAKTVARRALKDPESFIIISDVRFLNETKIVKELGGYLVKCNREIPYFNERDDHISEMALASFEGWDFELNNNGTIADLEETVQALLDHLLKGLKK